MDKHSKSGTKKINMKGCVGFRDLYKKIKEVDANTVWKYCKGMQKFNSNK